MSEILYDTLGVAINGNLTVAKILYPKMGFDPNKELALISLIATAPLVMVTAKDIPAGNDFVAAAKASGNKWNFGSVGVGSQGHLGVELMKSLMPGFKAVHVPFSGNPQVLNALLGGQIQLALMPPGVCSCWINPARETVHVHLGHAHAESAHTHDYLTPLADANAGGFLPLLIIPAALLVVLLSRNRMMSFAGLPDEQVWQLIAYVRSLAK